MNTVRVELGSRSYPITIGSGILPAIGRLLNELDFSGSIALVSNTTVFPLYGTLVSRSLSASGLSCTEIILPDGEEFKTMASAEKICEAMLRARLDRTSVLVALGGGVIGDLAGFAASVYMRGIDFIQIPTTLLAQVDSSVGGKTGVNHPLGKNMIGAFYQPKLVLADISTLDTLPDRELKAGLAEVIKYGLIRDPEFFVWLEENIERLLARDRDALAYAVHRSCANKAEVVAADERETGERALLNLGHTFGHAIETGIGYGEWLHGEAIAAGTLIAAELSRRLGWLDAEAVLRIERLFVRAGLPVRGAPLGAARYLALMRHDKKVQDGKLRLVLLKRIGSAVVSDEADEATIVAAIEARCT